MNRFMLFALLAAALAVLSAPEDTQARGRGRCGSAYAPAYYYPVYYHPAPSYYLPVYPPAPQKPPARAVVEVGAYDKVGFKPKSVTVAPGTTVRWTNHGKEKHTVTSRDGLFDRELPPGGTYSFTFKTPGTFHYYCRPHEKMGMVGTVVVGAAGSGGPGGTGSSGY
jgi:plastocyanin